MNIGHIIEGTINNLLDINESLYNKRIKICRECKLYKIHPSFGPICNNRLYLNPETDKISIIPKEGYIRGCNCLLESKCRVENASCKHKK